MRIPFQRETVALSLGLICIVPLAAADCQSASRFELNPSDNLVVDTQTGLMWQRCAVGRFGEDCGDGSAEAMSLAQANSRGHQDTTANHHNWRLPTKRELNSIADISCQEPSINAVAFPNTPPQFFWTDRGFAGDPAKNWVVNFRYGEDGVAPQHHPSLVRLVRSIE